MSPRSPGQRWKRTAMAKASDYNIVTFQRETQTTALPLTPEPLGLGPIFHVAGRSLLPSNDYACMRVDFPSVRRETVHRAFGTYRLPSRATGTVSRSVFSLRNVSPGEYPIA